MDVIGAGIIAGTTIITILALAVAERARIRWERREQEHLRRIRRGRWHNID